MSQIAHYYKRIAFVLIALACGLGVLAIVGLSSNGKGAVERYNALIAVDQAGGDVEGALSDLRSYVHSHMNAEIGGPNGIYPPIQLNGTYSRLTEEEQGKVTAANEPLYAQAQQYCEANGSRSFSGGERVQCVDEYVVRNGAAVQSIDPSLYTFDFVSPRWSADMAGLSLAGLVFCTLLSVYFGMRYVHAQENHP